MADCNTDLPRPTEFILPGDSRTAAQAYVCRTIVCRTECSIVAPGHTETIDEVLRQYVDRPSNLLFVLARVFNRANGDMDVLWRCDEREPA